MEDLQIIELYWQRSEHAVEETACKYGGYLNQISYQILRDPQDAEECVGDTYLHVWNAIPPQRPGAFRSWLGRIARNLSLDRFRARRAQKRGGEGTELLLSELEQCIPSGERDWEERELAQLLDSFLRGRTEIARLIFLRRYWYGDDIRQMAERFSVGESYIKSSLFRTRKALRQYLEKEGVSL